MEGERSVKPTPEQCLQLIDLSAEEVEVALQAMYPFSDRRWHAIAQTHLQQGFMALRRAVWPQATF